MPVTKSAIKTLRKEKRKEKINNNLRENLREGLRKAKKIKSAEQIRKAISFVDKAVKKNLIHKNKAARIKSSLSKLSKKPLNIKAKVASKTKPLSKKPLKKKTASPK